MTKKHSLGPPGWLAFFIPKSLVLLAHLFIFSVWLCRVFVVVSSLISSCGTWGLEHTGSVVALGAFGCLMACGILVPQPGIKPVSPALEDVFLTTGPPGNCLSTSLNVAF